MQSKVMYGTESYGNSQRQIGGPGMICPQLLHLHHISMHVQNAARDSAGLGRHSRTIRKSRVGRGGEKR